MIHPTRGARFSGTILHVSGSITLLAAMLAYVYFTLAMVFIPMGKDKLLLKPVLILIGLWLGAMLIHAAGQAMMRAGDYLQGKFGEMSQYLILKSSLYHLLKDICVVQVGFCVIGGICAGLAGLVTLATVLGVMIVVFSVCAYRLDKRLAVMELR